MTNLTPQEKIDLYKNIFRGRDDVFAMHWEKAVNDLLAEENGILVSPPGSGKTIMGIEMIAKLKQPTLILVHKKQIFNQWLERIESFLNIPKREIGQFCANKKKLSKQVTNCCDDANVIKSR